VFKALLEVLIIIVLCLAFYNAGLVKSSDNSCKDVESDNITFCHSYKDLGGENNESINIRFIQ